jgi:pyruvate-formate lyase-activating enzyme
LFHFHPGSLALTAGGWSCNFGCPWCQNWQITKKIPNIIKSRFLTSDVPDRPQALGHRPPFLVSELDPLS